MTRTMTKFEIAYRRKQGKRLHDMMYGKFSSRKPEAWARDLKPIRVYFNGSNIRTDQ